MPAQSVRNSENQELSIGDCLADTKRQLKHVIDVSEESANKTMDLVEGLLSILKELIKGSDMLQENYLILSKKQDLKNSPEQFEPIVDFMININEHSATMRKGLNTVMETQGFQDINGQVINRVINLLDEMETSLDESSFHTPISLNKTQGEGPSIDNNKETHCTEQNDVDDLLANLGL